MKIFSSNSAELIGYTYEKRKNFITKKLTKNDHRPNHKS